MLKGFIDFVREQGVVGLAVGFVLGGAVNKLVTSLVQDIINPVLGLVLGRGERFRTLAFTVRDVRVEVGEFLLVLIDFLVILAVVYAVIRIVQLHRLDKKKKS